MTGVDQAEVAPEEGDQRLDRWLRRRYPALTQGLLQKLLRTARKLMAGEVYIPARVWAGRPTA